MDPLFNEPLYECHGHLMMDGSDYTAAKHVHADSVNMEAVRAELRDLRNAGVTYFRDGGDAFDVGKAARPIAADYNIEYATPVFAIHKKGRYGWIVGRSFETAADYRQRIREAKEEEADFIKLIVSGIITFKEYGGLSCPSLEADEIRELIHITHEEGYAVMIHVNGPEAIRACVEAGADSIEHAYFGDEETLACIAEYDTIWVPTLAATEAFVGREGFDEEIASETVRRQIEAVGTVSRLRKKKQSGCIPGNAAVPPIAAGSDSGAVGVPHGPGTVREYRLLMQAGLRLSEIQAANEALRRRFRSRHSGTVKS